MKFDSEPALLNHCRLVHEPPTTTSDGCPQQNRPPSLASPPPVPASLPTILSPPPTNQRAGTGGFAPSLPTPVKTPLPTPVKKTPQATPPPPPLSTGKEGRQRSSGRRSAVSERFQLQPGQ